MSPVIAQLFFTYCRNKAEPPGETKNHNQVFFFVKLDNRGCEIFNYDIELKLQSRQWQTQDEPRLKSSEKQIKNQSHVYRLFYYCKVIVHHEFVPKGQTMTGAFYKNILRHFDPLEMSM